MDTSRADSSASVTFTKRGEAALDELATVLTAHCRKTPEGVARVLDEVMHTPLDDLTASLDSIASVTERRQQLHQVTDRSVEAQTERLDLGPIDSRDDVARQRLERTQRSAGRRRPHLRARPSRGSGKPR